MRKVCLLAAAMFCVLTSFAQKTTREQYIALHKDDAVRDMKRTGVPASITLAQAVFESNDGNSPLATEANNHFGIKCADWKGETYTHDDETKNECFRKYNSVLESYDDHSEFLRTRTRYASLFKLDPTDYKAWAHGLKKCGYATNPEYASRLIKIIEDYKLYELDNGKDIPSPPSQPVASTDKRATSKPATQKIISPSDDVVVNPYSTHEIFSNNNVRYVVAKKSDTVKSIAEEFQLGYWQIYKYNDLVDHSQLAEGQKIYIEPKKRNGKQSHYIVQPGQSLQTIAQEQGIKLRMLCKWNNLDENAQVRAGQKLFLEKKRS
jgi:LysM repeat protein